MFDARENLRNAILRNRVRVEEINLILNRSVPTTSSNRGRRRLIEEKLHLEQCIAELQVELQSKDRHQAERLFRWDDLDRRLLSAKTNDLAEEMHKRARDAENKISFETAKSGSSAYLSRLFDFHEQLINEWAERDYAAYCDTWTEQNRSIFPAFIRAIRDGPIRQLFAARKSTVAAAATDRAVRTGESPNPTAIKNWGLRIDRLENRWMRTLEAEAVKCEYLAARTVQGQAGQAAVSAEPPVGLPEKYSQNKSGRPPRLGHDFVSFAANLWLEAKESAGTKVSNEQLRQIGCELDAKGYVPPAEYLEGNYAKELKVFNSGHSNSKMGAIKTWSQLVSLNDKDQVRGMRRLLSRCAKNRDRLVPLSGN